MNDILIDQDFRSIIPPLTPEEYAGLEASLIREGNRVPIDTWRGYVVDGHNRYDICHKHNIPLKPANEVILKTKEDVLEWIIRNQFGRRNINNYVRSVLALKLEDIISAKAKGNLVTPTGGKKSLTLQKSAESIDTRQELAKIAHVSHDTIAKVKTIEAKATPEQKAKLARGDTKTTIHSVFKDIKREEKKVAQDKARAEAVITNYDNDDDLGIVEGDISKLHDLIPNDSVELFFTDPPYDKDNIHLYGEIAELAQAKLVSGGLCLAYAAHPHLPQIINDMQKHLDFWWIFAVYQSGGEARIWSRQLWVRWKPIIVFSKRPMNGRITDTWLNDAVRGAGEDKRYHKWGQDIQEATYWIESLTTPNGLVVDPLCGGGTIPLACKLTNRQWIGCDIDPLSVATTRKRLQENNSGDIR